ncbi:MAG: DUF3786 domain-containing protein [Desulfobacteraceae bacterium]|nr:MAG: DUF3786 domain-containing protein [Desulfobacteraceae bacterium]
MGVAGPLAEVSPIFEKTYRNYLNDVGQYDFSPHQSRLGMRVNGNQMVIPFFGKEYAVSSAGVFLLSGDGAGPTPGFAASVVICKYLLLGTSGNDISDDSEWASYKDFRDAAPLLDYFRHNAEQPIGACFSGRIVDLESAVLRLGGRHVTDDLSYDLKMRIVPLPRVPVLLLFNDADAEFPAECRILFERRAETFLDMESLAIVGALTAGYLKACLKSPDQA